MKKLTLLLLPVLIAGYPIAAQSYSTVSTYSGTTIQGLVDGPVATAQFNRPYSICTDVSTGTVYVSDTYNNCIRKISGGQVTTLAGNGTAGDVDAQGANARFDFPAGICFYNGDLYLTDNGNNKIKKIDAAGNVTTIAGTGAPGYLDGLAASAQFYNPFDIKVNSQGELIIADYLNHCIRKISGGMVTTIAGAGGVSGDQTGTAANTRFNRPRSICFDATGNLYIADMLNHRIKVLTSGGMVNPIAGSGVAGSQNGTGTGAEFNNPLGVEMDLFGNILIVDGSNHKIRRSTPAGVVSTIAGSGTAGYLDGPALTSRFNIPAGIAMINGKIYVCDVLNHAIRTLDKEVGLEETEQTVSALFIFPNPANSTFTIQNDDANPVALISIYDIQGVLVKQIKPVFAKGNLEIDIAELASGSYVIEAVLSDGEKSVGRVIKK